MVTVAGVILGFRAKAGVVGVRVDGDAEDAAEACNDPSCMDKKYLVAAWRSCSRSSAV